MPFSFLPRGISAVLPSLTACTQRHCPFPLLPCYTMRFSQLQVCLGNKLGALYALSLLHFAIEIPIFVLSLPFSNISWPL